MGLGLADVPADVAGAVRVRAKGNRYLGVGEATQQPSRGIVVVEALAGCGGRDLNAATRIVRALGHLLPKRCGVKVGRKAFLRKAHDQVGMSHHIKVKWAFAGAAPVVDVALPHAAHAQVFPNVQVGVVVDPTAKGIGCIGASDVFRFRRTRGTGHDIAWVANPMHAAKAYDGALGPALYQGLATLVPIAFKTVDKGELRSDLRGEFAGVLKGQTMCRQVTLDNLYFAVGVHAGGQGEVIGRDHDAAAGRSSGTDVVLKRGMPVRKRGVGMAIDQRAHGHSGSFASSESASL